MAGQLVVVGTPIGNLQDISPRALEALETCDFIAAEDTRVTLKLLNHFGIKKPMVSYFEHNKTERGDGICRRMEAGETACIVTDAGMPCISDPGEMLVAQCYERGIPVTVVPGPSAVISALAISGLPTGRFTFEGFLSGNKKLRPAHLEELQREKRTMILYEAPHKLLATLEDLVETLGDREISIVRELTKIHEEVIRTTLHAAVERYSQEAPKGEIVLILKGAEDSKEEALTLEQAVEWAKRLIEEGKSPSEAAKTVAQQTEFHKGEIYRELV